MSDEDDNVTYAGWEWVAILGDGVKAARFVEGTDRVEIAYLGAKPQVLDGYLVVELREFTPSRPMPLRQPPDGTEVRIEADTTALTAALEEAVARRAQGGPDAR